MIEAKRLEKIKNCLKKYPLFEFLGKGKRGEAYKLSETIAAKIGLDNSPSKDSIKNEYEILKKLDSKFFPKAIYYDPKLKFMVRELVKGKTIDKTMDKSLFLKALHLARELDLKRINQQELKNPYKHIFFYKKKAMMIDFERAKISNKPKNVTQFCQYICNKFRIDPKKLAPIMKDYKKSNSENDFKRIIKILKELMRL